MFNFLFGKKKVAIVFDIGGTNMRIARATPSGIDGVTVEKTPQNPVDGIVLLLELARKLSSGYEVVRAAGCIAGSVSAQGVVSDARNLLDWEGVNIQDRLKEGLGVEVEVWNDGALVGLGEQYYGAGVGSRRMAYITVSTGVGGAMIVDGALEQQSTEFAVGRIALHGSDLESLVSGTAVEKKFGFPPYELDSLEEREKLADMLAEGLATVMGKWRPDTIVLGGSMIVGKRNTIPLTRIQESLANITGGEIPTIKLAELQDIGGLQGGRALVYSGK